MCLKSFVSREKYMGEKIDNRVYFELKEKSALHKIVQWNLAIPNSE